MSWINFIGGKAASLRNRLVDQYWERRFGVSTCGNVPIHHFDSILYNTISYKWILRILDSLDWRADDVFVDIGCGKGRVLCCAARHPARKIIGVDLDKNLCEQARANAQRMRGRKAPIEVVHARAHEFDYRECTKFFLFHPFGPSTLQLVLEAIEVSCQLNPRPIQLVYLNPVHEGVVMRAARFEQYDRWTPRPWGTLKYDVAFWKRSLSLFAYLCWCLTQLDGKLQDFATALSIGCASGI
jgi:SAM-dependent methyltransferase